MFRKIALVTLFIILSGCQDENELQGCTGEPFRLTNTQEMNLVIAGLEEKGIPYKIDDQGFILYLLNDYSEVRGIVNIVRYGDNLLSELTESRTIRSQDELEFYISNFDKSGISYKVLTDGKGSTLIEWPLEFSIAVYEIIEHVESERKEAISGNSCHP